jgi:hypothetical protein
LLSIKSCIIKTTTTIRVTSSDLRRHTPLEIKASSVATRPNSGFHIHVHAGADPGLASPTPSHLPLPRHRKANMSLNRYHVLPKHRHLYGMKGIVVYASSHPSDPSCLADPLMSTWAPIKNLFAIGASDLDAEFTAVYESIHDSIVSSILATLSDSDWGLNVLRLGFNTKHLKNPITIHLVVAPNGGLSEDTACKIVSDILTIIAAAPYSSQL